jgi:hypothetical protein
LKTKYSLIQLNFARFEVHTTLNMEMIVFWDATPCSLVDIYPEDESSLYLRSVGVYRTTRVHIPDGITLNLFFLKCTDFRQH